MGLSLPALAALPSGIVWLSGSGAPTDGEDGTGAGVAPKGSKYTDLDSGVEYTNQGTQASPEWHGTITA